MSITHSQKLSVNTNGASPISGSQTEVGSAEIEIDSTYAAGSANTILAAAFTAANVQSLILVADQAMTLSTNGTNEVQTLSTTGTVTAGTFTLTYSGQTTSAIAWNAAASAVQAALIALSNIGPSDMVCTGGPLPATPVVCTFTGTLGNTNVAQMTSTDTLTGGSTSIATTTAGVAPSNTIALVAGSPLLWSRSAAYYANPFTADVTRFNVTTATGNRLRGKVLTS
jgi:hypothetical protein